MKNLSIVIMAHPERADFIPYLQERLGGDVPVVWDEKNNIWDTCRRAWLAQDLTADYALVIQDDAIICDDFRERALDAIDRIAALKYPDPVISFYAGWMLENRVRVAQRTGKDYVVSPMIMNEVALCLKTRHIDEMVKFCDDRNADTDQLITRLAQQRQMKTVYTVPSLVDHRDSPSIYKRVYGRKAADRPRKAVAYIDA